MFTGIVSGRGTVASIGASGRASGNGSRADEKRLVVRCGYIDVQLGESIAVNGVCLTVAEIALGQELLFHASAETCDRTNLGALAAGDRVNLERALRLSDRLSGHLVQGHVDGVGRLVTARAVGECRELEIELPAASLRYVIEKGSIALDGVSLTVNSINGSRICVMVIPQTWQNTTLSTRRPGQVLNVELDMVAKYLERFSDGRRNHDS